MSALFKVEISPANSSILIYGCMFLQTSLVNSTTSFVKSGISLVNSSTSFVKSGISLLNSNTSFVKSGISLVNFTTSFDKRGISFVNSTGSLHRFPIKTDKSGGFSPFSMFSSAQGHSLGTPRLIK